VVAAAGMAFAGSPLWGPDPDDFPSLQVKVPAAQACWDENPTPGEENPCYTATAGWWYGYQYDAGKAEIKKSATVGGETEWGPFGDGVSITDPTAGETLIDSDALRVRLTAKSSDGTKYGGAGVGFDFGKPKTDRVNITAQEGYILDYQSDGALQFKLGYDETSYSDACSWDAALPAKATRGQVTLTWADFKQPSWCPGSETKPIIAKEVALANAESAKIAIAASNSATETVVTLAIYGLEWVAGTSPNPNPSPIVVSGKGAASPVSFNMAGKMLSLNSSVGPVSVQVINLQGAVVRSKTMGNAEKMNLSSLPTGVYIVRVPAQGYVHKFTVK